MDPSSQNENKPIFSQLWLHGIIFAIVFIYTPSFFCVILSYMQVTSPKVEEVSSQQLHSNVWWRLILWGNSHMQIRTCT